MIAALLSWTKLPQWGMELIIFAIIAGGVWYWHHEAIEKGIAHQVAADKAASAIVQKQTEAQTVALQAKATLAEHDHDQEIATLTAYRDTHPIQPVRLCDSTTRYRFVPQTGTPNPGDAATRSSPPNLQPVSPGDHQLRTGNEPPDLSSLLGLLATRADQTSAELREYQSR